MVMQLHAAWPHPRTHGTRRMLIVGLGSYAHVAPAPVDITSSDESSPDGLGITVAAWNRQEPRVTKYKRKYSIIVQ